MRMKMKEEKETKISLEGRIKELESKKQNLIEKMDQIQKKYQSEKNELKDQISSLENDFKEAAAQIQDLEGKLNSVYYFVGSKDELKDQHKIKGTFLGICGTRIEDVTAADFKERVDLRETDAILLSASDAGVQKIEKIGILPKHIENGKDFRVEIAADRQSAKIVLLSKEKFLLARLIIYLN